MRRNTITLRPVISLGDVPIHLKKKKKMFMGQFRIHQWTIIIPYMHRLFTVINVNVLKFGTFYSILFGLNFGFYVVVSSKTKWNAKQCRPTSDCSFRSSLIWVCTFCMCHFVRNFGVQNFKTYTLLCVYCIGFPSAQISFLRGLLFKGRTILPYKGSPLWQGRHILSN